MTPIRMERQAALRSPPKVVDRLFDWASAAIAAKLLPIVTKRYETNLASSRDKTIDKHFRKQFEEHAAIAAKLLAEVKKYARAPVNSSTVFDTFPLDLTGWPYKLPGRVPSEVVGVIVFDDPHIKFGAARFMESGPDGSAIGTIAIYASQRGLNDIWVNDDLRKAFRRIETSIEHEAQHLAQVLLQRSTGNASAGYPTPARADNYDPFTEPEKYHLDPREFWPLLDSVAREIRLKLDGVPPPKRSNEIRRLIDQEPMLRTLAAKSPSLWVKAVRELAKKLGPEGVALRVAARFIYR